MNNVTLNYGGQKLHLTKSKKFIGIKLSTNRSRTPSVTHRRVNQSDTGIKLARFNVLDISNSSQDVENVLDGLRISSDVQLGTHVFHTSDDEVPFIPSGEIYICFKKSTSVTQCQKILDKYHLQIVKALDKKELEPV